MPSKNISFKDKLNSLKLFLYIRFVKTIDNEIYVSKINETSE